MARGIGPRQPRWAKQGFKPAKRKPVTPVKRAPEGDGARSRATGLQQSRKAAAGPARAIAPPKGYNPLAPSRVTEILRRLDATYPDVTCALRHRSAWELLVATILSAQCTDERVNLVTPVIFAKYPSVQHF